MLLFLWTLLCGLGAAAVLIVAHYALPHWRPDGYTRPIAYVLGTTTLFGGYAVWALLAPAGTRPLETVAALFVITALGGAGDVAAYAWDQAPGRSV